MALKNTTLSEFFEFEMSDMSTEFRENYFEDWLNSVTDKDDSALLKIDNWAKEMQEIIDNIGDAVSISGENGNLVSISNSNQIEDSGMNKEEMVLFTITNDIPDMPEDDDGTYDGADGGETDLSDYYTKTEVDDLLDSVEVDLSDYYTKTEVDSAISNAVDSLDIPEETDLGDYYTKTEVNDLLDSVEVDLSGYYTKTEAYSKAEVDDLLDSSNSSEMTVKMLTEAEYSALTEEEKADTAIIYAIY